MRTTSRAIRCLVLTFLVTLIMPQIICTAADVVYPPVSESVARLSSQDEYAQQRGISDLTGMGERAAPAYDVLFSVALSSDYRPGIRSGAVQALKNIDEEKASGQFIRQLTNSSPSMREYAVDALMTITRSEAAVPLFNRLKDENEQVRHRAGIALQFYKSDQLAELLIASLEKRDDRAREWAPWLLGRMKSQAALEPLHALLDDDIPKFHKSVIAALRDIQSKASVSHLIKVVAQDKDDEVRMRAIQCLGELDDQKAAASLLLALDDKNPEVRSSAASAIGDLGVESAKPQLREILKQDLCPETLAAMSALCRMKDTASIPLIVKHLNTEHETVAVYMMRGLMELDAEAEITKLRKDGNPLVRKVAEKALVKLKKRKVIQQDKSSVRDKPRR